METQKFYESQKQLIMKKLNVVIGVLSFFLLMTVSSQAQKTNTEQKEQKIKTEKLQKVERQKKEVLTEKKLAPKITQPTQPVQIEKAPERVIHNPIDPITGEQVASTPSPSRSYVSITFPETNLSGGEGLNGKIKVQGRSIEGHTVEIRVQSGTVNASNYLNRDPYLSKIIEDWRPVTVNSEGVWETTINAKPLSYNAGGDFDNDEQHFFTILVRDTNDRSEVKVLHLTRLSS